MSERGGGGPTPSLRSPAQGGHLPASSPLLWLFFVFQSGLGFVVIFFKSTLLRYNLHTIKYTSFKVTVQRVLTNI